MKNEVKSCCFKEKLRYLGCFVSNPRKYYCNKAISSYFQKFVYEFDPYFCMLQGLLTKMLKSQFLSLQSKISNFLHILKIKNKYDSTLVATPTHLAASLATLTLALR